VQGGDCIVDYEIAFDSQAEATAASEKMKDKNALFTDPDVFKSVFRAEMKEAGVSNAVVDAVNGAEPRTQVNRVELFTRSTSEELDADATAATADAVPLFSGGTFVGGIALGMSLCAIVFGIVWMRRSRGGITFKTPKFRAKPSRNSFGLHGGETELTEITISNKKTTNPAFGHSKKLAAAAKKKKKRKSQTATAQKPGAANTGKGGDLEVHTDAYGRRYTFNAKTNETKWLVDTTSPSEPTAASTPTDAAKPQGGGERKEKEKEKNEVLTDAQGRRYTYNHKSGESSWLHD